MWQFLTTAFSALAEHPKAGALASLLTLAAAAMGYVWGTNTFVSIEDLDGQLVDHRQAIIQTVDKRIIRRDIETKEETLRQYTQMIQLGLCPRDDCAYTQAEKETLQRQIDTLQRKLE